MMTVTPRGQVTPAVLDEDDSLGFNGAFTKLRVCRAFKKMAS